MDFRLLGPLVACDGDAAPPALGARRRRALLARLLLDAGRTVLDGDGELVHREGRTPSPGLAVLRLRLQRCRASHLIGGVGADARAPAGHPCGADAPWTAVRAA